MVLVRVAFVVRLGRKTPKVLHVCSILIQVGQGNCIFLADLPIELSFQGRPLIVREGQGEEGFGLTNKLVYIALSSNLQDGDKSHTAVSVAPI